MNAKDIAGRLTKAQREMLAWNCGGYVLLPECCARKRLERKGLIEPFLPDFMRGAGWQPTDIGLAVREAIMQEEG